MVSSLSDEQMSSEQMRVLQRSLYPVDDRATLLLPAPRSLDRNSYESELKAKARMDSAFTELETTVLRL